MDNKDYTEFEVKFYPVDKEKYRKKLLSIGAKLDISERKMIRVNADSKANSFMPSDIHIRVRDEGNLVRLSVKTSASENGKLSDQKEIDVTVSDFTKTVKIIEATGIKFNYYVENLREEWAFNGTQITIDTWPGLETYSEIEAESEEKVKEMAEMLGFNWDKKIITPAAQLYAKTYGISIDEALTKLNNISFENNPFKNLKRIWAPKNQGD